MRVSELENAKAAMERDVLTARAMMTGGEESARQKVATLTDALDELRMRERRLEEQRHNLELTLASSREEVKDLVSDVMIAIMNGSSYLVSLCARMFDTMAQRLELSSSKPPSIGLRRRNQIWRLSCQPSVVSSRK